MTEIRALQILINARGVCSRTVSLICRECPVRHTACEFLLPKDFNDGDISRMLLKQSKERLQELMKTNPEEVLQELL